MRDALNWIAVMLFCLVLNSCNIGCVLLDMRDRLPPPTEVETGK